MKAALAYVEYENVRRKERKVIGIHQLEMSQYYPKDIEIADVDLRQDPPAFQIQSHMFVYMPEYESRHTASLVFMATQDEKIERIESGTDDGVRTVWNYFLDSRQNDRLWYYCPAKFKGKRDDCESDYIDEANEVTSAGVWTINIYHDGGILFKLNVKILSSVSEENYQLMLKDLVKIHQELALNAHGSVGFNAKWEHIYVDLAKQIANFKDTIKRISISPKTNLHQEYSIQNAHKIKKYSPKTIQDIYINGRQSVKAISYSEDFNIYEHRAIKLFLLQMRRLCERCHSIAEDEKKRDINELEKIIKEHPENKPILERIRSNTELVDDLFCNRFRILTNNRSEKIAVEFSVTSSAMDCIYDDKSKLFGLFPVLFKNDNGRFSAEPICADINIYKTYKFDFVGVDIRYTGLEGLAFFYECIQSIKKTNAKQVTISGYCLYEPKTTPADAPYPRYSFVFSNIESITIDGKANQFSDFDITKNAGSLEMLKNDLLCDAWRDDKVRFEMEIVHKRQYSSYLTSENGIENEFDRIATEVDAISNLPLLRSIRPSDSIHITPVFQRDSQYRKAFSIMKKYQQQLKAVDLVDASRYPVRKTCDIYEYWCFIKILSIFVTEYAFELRQFGQLKDNAPLSLIEDISSYITQGSYEGTYALLYHDTLEMTVELIFNGSLAQKDNPNSLLRPDYQLIIKKNTTVLHFCMDAKYRDYSEQVNEWENDVVGVAKTKYIDKTKDFINGSYILHSDNKHKPFYAGNKSVITRNIGEVSGDESYVCRIGSVDLLPQNTDHFKTLLQMLFELFIGDETGYRTKCWLCGSDNVAVKCLQTSGGFPKYHMTCKNPACNSFWVENHCSEEICHHREFGKHLFNYLEESTAGNGWLVKCPLCEHDGQQPPNMVFRTDQNVQSYDYEEPPPLDYSNITPPDPTDNWYYEM